MWSSSPSLENDWCTIQGKGKGKVKTILAENWTIDNHFRTCWDYSQHSSIGAHTAARMKSKPPVGYMSHLFLVWQCPHPQSVSYWNQGWQQPPQERVREPPSPDIFFVDRFVINSKPRFFFAEQSSSRRFYVGTPRRLKLAKTG
jgi:hypothetical protein